jgi:cytoskeletal protein CcmA (bactofilin family)
MFRRKEEGLFDSDIDQDQTQNESAQDDKSAGQQATSSFNTSSTAHSASSSPAASSTSNAQAAARPNNPAAPTANSFRPATAASPAAPLAADLTRNRLPEAKQPAASVTASFATPLPMPGSDKSKSVKRVLTVGNDILLKGEIATCDRLVIEGKVDATLNDVHTVEIAECGSFKGSAQIEDAEISGLFEGELTVRGRLVIYATGKVRGKISYGEIEIERGGELSGEIKMAGASAVAARPIARASSLKDDRVAA